MNSPSLFADDWPALRATADRILAQRRDRDPGLVDRGRMPAAEAATRLRVATALVAQWRSIAERHDAPYDPEQVWTNTLGREGAHGDELRADLAAAAARAHQLADAKPDDASAAAFADAVAALAWHERPRVAGNSHILDVARANAAVRDRLQPRQVAA